MRFPRIHPRLVLPLMIFLGVLIIGVRAADVWGALSEGRIFDVLSPARAVAEVPAITPPTLNTPAADEKAASGEKTEASTPAGEAAPTRSAQPGEEPTGAEMALVKQLTDRRDQLEQRARALDSRDALIRVAEQRVDQKIKEMETLRAQLQTMVGQASAAQQTQIENLVKIYETMKPKEAARIFETLELPVLLGVVQKMKPQRTAAVMAEMKPEKAKEITVALTKQDQLPQIK